MKSSLIREVFTTAPNPSLLCPLGFLFLLLRLHFQYFCETVSFPSKCPFAPSSELPESNDHKKFPTDMEGRALLPGTSPYGCLFCHKDQTFLILKARLSGVMLCKMAQWEALRLIPPQSNHWDRRLLYLSESCGWTSYHAPLLSRHGCGESRSHC